LVNAKYDLFYKALYFMLSVMATATAICVAAGVVNPLPQSILTVLVLLLCALILINSGIQLSRHE